MKGEDVSWEPMSFPKISESFILGGVIYSGLIKEDELQDKLEALEINVITEEKEESRGYLKEIHPYTPGTILNNWTAEDLPTLFRDVSK